MPLSRNVARFNRRALNRLTINVANKLPGFAIVIHTGRKSGKVYRTPVNAFPRGNEYIIALTYGSDTDWVRHVLSAGGCEIETQRRHIRLTNPRLMKDPDISWARFPVRQILGLINAPEYLRLTVVSVPRVSRCRYVYGVSHALEAETSRS